MLNLQPHLTRDCEGVSRRSFLQVGGVAGLGLTLPTLLAQQAARRPPGRRPKTSTSSWSGRKGV